MAKKIKFPLEVANGVQARTIEELRDNFDIDKVLEYFIDGKLQTWLEDRYYEEESEKIAALSTSEADLKVKLAEVFGVTFENSEEVDIEAIEIRNQKLKKLKQFTEDEEILKNVDSVAFDQEELAELYDLGVETIYLCEGEFNIPKSKQNLTYIELGGATVKGKAVAQAAETKAQSTAEQYGNNDVIVRLSSTDSGIFAALRMSLKNDLIISDLDGRNKIKLASNVTSFAKYQNTIVYVEEVDDNGKLEFVRYDISTKEKTKLNIECERSHHGIIKYICMTSTSIIWAQGSYIYMTDYDGDFKEVISGPGIPTNISKMQLLDNAVYFLPAVKVETGLFGEVKYQPVYKIDLISKRRITIANDVHTFTVGENKVYFANTQYKVYECDLDGNDVKLIHNLKPGHRLTNMSYENGSLILSEGGKTDDVIIKVER